MWDSAVALFDYRQQQEAEATARTYNL